MVTWMFKTAYNSGHTATLRSAQIQPYGCTSHVRKPLSDMQKNKYDPVDLKCELRIIEIKEVLEEFKKEIEKLYGKCMVKD